jgi:hypothetical protein
MPSSSVAALALTGHAQGQRRGLTRVHRSQNERWTGSHSLMLTLWRGRGSERRAQPRAGRAWDKDSRHRQPSPADHSGIPGHPVLPAPRDGGMSLHGSETGEKAWAQRPVVP